MLTKLLKTTLALSVMATIAFSAQGVRFNVVDGDAEAKHSNLVNKEIQSVGFVLSDPHVRINDAYKVKYGTKKLANGKVNPQYDPKWVESLDNLGFFTISNDTALRPLLLKAPQLGAFSPFNLHTYKMKSEDKTYVGHVVPSTMLDIVGVKDKATRAKFEAMFVPLDKLVQKKIGGKVEINQYDALPAKKMMTFEISFDRPEDLEDYLDEFQEEFEAAFEEKQYIIAGFKNFKEVYEDADQDFDKYDAYFTYSLCHFTYSYNMFNKGRPDAGAFAPCSMYMYIEKGTNKVVIGMPLLKSWVAVLNIKDKTKAKSADDLDKEIIGILKSLGAKEI
ncbi:MAG: hypothetical protein JJW00_08235 [Sulfurimonas sp.]|nr:hypothetical protein [Sulfurimonas sp.]